MTHAAQDTSPDASPDTPQDTPQDTSDGYDAPRGAPHTSAAPLTPADCDCRGLPFMPLDVARLRDCDLTALSTGEEFKAAVLLWCAAWGQLPAASLPDDARILARLAGVSLAEWRAVSAMALKGWVRCADGRLYHPVVAEKALEAWAGRLRQRDRAQKRWARAAEGAAGEDEAAAQETAAQETAAQDTASQDTASQDTASQDTASKPSQSRGQEDGMPRHPREPAAGMQGTGTGTGRETGTGTGTDSPPERPAPGSLGPDALAWSRGVALLTGAGRLSEARARAFFGRLLRGPPSLEARELLAAIAAAEANSTGDPQAYLAKAALAIARRRGPARGPITANWDEATWRIACRNFRNEGAWSDDMGPEPGRPGCLAPEGVLAEFGWAA